MRAFLAVATGKLLRILLRMIRRGGGSALPGVVAARIDPDLLKRALGSCTQGIVVVSGSAGKSSTTFHLVNLLRDHGLKVFTNPSTANIKQGLFTAVLKEANLRGRIHHDIAVLEWDEGHGAALATDFDIRLCVLTNVLSDQLDRFVDPEVVAQKLQEIANHATTIVINADDKNLCQLDLHDKEVLAFGLSDQLLNAPEAPHYALNFGPHPRFHRSAIVRYNEGFKVDLGAEYGIPVETSSLALNYAGALLAASKIVDLDTSKVLHRFSSREGVFARNEITEVLGRGVNLRLVQNPTSFQLNLNELKGDETPLMLMAGRDIHDPSWLWTVDFSSLKRVDVVGGFNAYELALRLSVAGVQVGEVRPEISDATEAFFELPGTKPTILFSADAMRRFRRHTKVAK